MVFQSQVRPSTRTVFAASHVLPTAVRQETMVRARDQPCPILQLDTAGRLDAAPMIKNTGLDIATIGAYPDRAVDSISHSNVREELRSAVCHENRSLTIEAVRARMEASSVRVEAPA